jgi:WASH complex subunit strumpellin
MRKQLKNFNWEIGHFCFSAQKAAAGDSNIDDVCKLLCGTGFQNTVTARRPPNYPESYFKYQLIHL